MFFSCFSELKPLFQIFRFKLSHMLNGCTPTVFLLPLVPLAHLLLPLKVSVGYRVDNYGTEIGRRIATDLA